MMSLTNSSPGEIAKSASIASRLLATLSGAERDDALTALHEAIAKSRNDILAANSRDVAAAERAVEAGVLNQSVLKRLDLSRPGKFEDMLQGILSVRDLQDPVGNVTMRTLLDDGLTLEKVSCPIGVLLIIFEARPEVIANIAALSIKSGNAAILKGGKESTESFMAISKVISEAIAHTQVPKASIQLVETREVVSSLLAQNTYIDLVIPRGSKDLVRFVQDNTKIPVLGHADGLCSAYIHRDADPDVALKVIVDSKTDYPAACNSLETLLVHEDVLHTIFPAVAEALLAKGVSLRCDPSSKEALSSKIVGQQHSLVSDAVESDYETEFLDLILAVKTIPGDDSPGKSLDAAIAHINRHSSKHTDMIVTRSRSTAERFMNGVDSAGAFWNASTRFADGMRYGFGTEVGISTNKVHSRGPVGLDGLTIYKYKVRGQGHRAADYSGTGSGKSWKHEALPL
ncbi:glutamate-5-semialdehyde dehydrogenase [Aspergillus fijiensis CBS 313.89]|uniref:glutamate-5-semialdehyde dehydrogenase n=1 Tax=Aspergillus fijiensis CBS 313.89 TaxID=1448319 RepID=A0A8G1VUX2_9EURO|nr:gamma-glutamyl phosphate reductase [Aspergillus fijiensis CBS 313.89]RAK72618.1 gamma-glutamyl phosphate reductase [Aspergillus fijiensis CBS 313.89]